MLSPSYLLGDLRRRVFASPVGQERDRIGVEVEFLALASGSGAPAFIDALGRPSTLPLLRRFGAAHGWIEEPTAAGVPRFRTAGAGWLSFEPGGQLELSAPALPSVSALLGCLRGVLPPLATFLEGEGVELRSAGLDPLNPLDGVPLQLGGERYTRMAAYFARLGPAGGRMMRQTAAFQLNLDFGGEGALRWRVLNAAAPYLLAIFANSPLYQGQPTGHRSYRAHAWRELDPARTGLLACGSDPAAEYLDFALAAPPMLRCPADAEHGSFADWLACGEPGLAEWRAHLGTLFPEVRPKGYLELRCLDAVAPAYWAAPLALVGGLVYDTGSLRAAADLLGAPRPELLRAAGEAGLEDELIAGTARDLFEIGLAGAARLGDGFVTPADLEQARAFFDRYTRRSLSPADDAAVPVTCDAA